MTAKDRYLLAPLAPADSSNIASIGYAEEHRMLNVEFKSGALHSYDNVPPDLHAEFMAALSKGIFYSSNVRGKFTSMKLTGECPKCGAKPGLIGETCLDCERAKYAGECGAEGPRGVRCSKVKGHDVGADPTDDDAFHGRGKTTWVDGGT